MRPPATQRRLLGGRVGLRSESSGDAPEQSREREPPLLLQRADLIAAELLQVSRDRERRRDHQAEASDRPPDRRNEEEQREETEDEDQGGDPDAPRQMRRQRGASHLFAQPRIL